MCVCASECMCLKTTTATIRKRVKHETAHEMERQKRAAPKCSHVLKRNVHINNRVNNTNALIRIQWCKRNEMVGSDHEDRWHECAYDRTKHMAGESARAQGQKNKHLCNTFGKRKNSPKNRIYIKLSRRIKKKT